jgi:RNA-directed DNA polymerase
MRGKVAKRVLCAGNSSNAWNVNFNNGNVNNNNRNNNNHVRLVR